MLFLSVVCSLLGVAFAVESMGLYTHELNVAAAAVLLVVGAALDPTTRASGGTASRRLAVAGAVLGATGLVCLPLPVSVRAFAVAIWFAGLEMLGRGRGGKTGPAASLALGAALLGVFVFTTRTSLLAWYATDHASRWISSQAAALTGRPLSLGPTFAGFELLVLSVGCCVGGARQAGRRTFTRALACALLVGGVYVAFLALFAWTPGLPSLLEGRLPEPWPGRLAAWLAGLHPAHMALLLALPLACVVGLGLCSAHAVPAPAGRLPGRAGWLVLPCLVAAAAALTNLPAPVASEPRRVAFYEKGFINWLTPSHDMYGSRSGGMFGNLPALMEHMGWESRLLDHIDDEALADRDILVIINQFESFSEESRRSIDAFVRRGGALLVLGDHTFYKGPDGLPPDQPVRGETLQINQPLRTSRIAFRFDSAYYVIGGWLHSLAFSPHWIVAGSADATNETGCVVGASLELRYPAAPLVVGRYGYSDAGVHPSVPGAASRGYMHNSRYDPGEELGDMVLVAAEDVGIGKVAVIGDTSGLVNAIQVQTWPYVVRLFHWLGSDGRAAVPLWRDVLGLTLLALAAALLIQGDRTTLLLGSASGLVAGMAGLALVTSWVTPPALQGRVALVDLSHVGRHSIEGWRERGVSGLYLNLMRAGFHTLGARRFDDEQLRAADLFVSVAPTSAYDAGELDRLWTFMQEGGTVLLAVGHEDRSGALTLLDRAGLRIPQRPLGREAARAPGAPSTPAFFEAWPVLGAAESLVTVRDEPVVVSQPVGRGRLVVIGDTDFLLNRNLEVEEGAILHNVRFLAWLLGRIVDGDSP